jgi:hypothetical protein
MSPGRFFQNVGRAPRHDVRPRVPCEVRAELSSRDPIIDRPAQLVNLSRQGLQIAVGEPLASDEVVTVRIREVQGRLDVALRGRVRWQRSLGSQTWGIGCELEEPLSYEALGELFLSGVLDMGSAE